jgi:hypothetical protein
MRALSRIGAKEVVGRTAFYRDDEESSRGVKCMISAGSRDVSVNFPLEEIVHIISYVILISIVNYPIKQTSNSYYNLRR